MIPIPFTRNSEGRGFGVAGGVSLGVPRDVTEQGVAFLHAVKSGGGTLTVKFKKLTIK